MSRLKNLLNSLPPLTLPYQQQALAEFTLFPKLPLELRNKIWRHTTEDTRIIKLYEIQTISTAYGWESSVKGQSRHPAIMQVNQESRCEGRKNYKLCYEKAQLAFSERFGKVPRQIQEAEVQMEVAETEEKRIWGAGPDKGRMRSNAVYVNFEQDIFLIMRRNHISESYKSASAMTPPSSTTLRDSLFDATIDEYTLAAIHLEHIERLEQIFDNNVFIPMALISAARIRDLTMTFEDYGMPEADNVHGDLIRRRFVERVVRGLGEITHPRLKPRLPFSEMSFQTRWLRDFGEELDPSGAVVHLDPAKARQTALVLYE